MTICKKSLARHFLSFQIVYTGCADWLFRFVYGAMLQAQINAELFVWLLYNRFRYFRGQQELIRVRSGRYSQLQIWTNNQATSWPYKHLLFNPPSDQNLKSKNQINEQCWHLVQYLHTNCKLTEYLSWHLPNVNIAKTELMLYIRNIRRIFLGWYYNF